MTEEYYIKLLRELISQFGNDDEAFHGHYDDLLVEIIEKELKFKAFFEVFDKEYKGYMWVA